MQHRLSISLQDVSVRRGATWALRGITLTLQPGERWALLGDNGSGKTQLLKCLATAVWPTPTRTGRRLYRAGGHELDLRDAKPRMAYIGAELQDKYARYEWNLTVRELLGTGVHGTDLLLRHMTQSEARRVQRTLAACRLERLAERRFLSLSYGQKRLALLARALIGRPDWLLLDEFYNGLDTEFRAVIDGVLDGARRRGQSWIASAHRAVDVPRGTRRVMELRAGRLHAITRWGVHEAARLAAAADEARVVGLPRGRPPGGIRATPARATPAGETLVRISKADVYVEYRPVLRGLDWELRAGEHWAVFGGNGAGKSTFLKLLYGDLSPALGGHIERAGVEPGTPIADWKRRVGMVSPELQTDHAIDISILDLVVSGRHASIGLVDEAAARERRSAQRWLEFFALSSVARRRPRELSYGQLRRALMARALVGDARLLLLDEPLTGLDPRQRAAMKHTLERLMKRKVTLVIAVHHAEDLPRGIGRALRLHRRRAHAVTL